MDVFQQPVFRRRQITRNPAVNLRIFPVRLQEPRRGAVFGASRAGAWNLASSPSSVANTENEQVSVDGANPYRDTLSARTKVVYIKGHTLFTCD